MPKAARKNDTHQGICAHGALCCPHNVSGTITSGSPDVLINSRPAARLGDTLTHNCPHCGTGHIASASGSVTINGRGAARLGDAVVYPGGGGVVTSGSDSVSIGD